MNDSQGECGFQLLPEDIPKSLRQEIGGYRCSREVWKGFNRCIWHAEIDNKPIDGLKEARGTGNERLIGAYLRQVEDLNKMSLNECKLHGANLQEADLSEGDFSRTNFRFADFAGAEMTNSDFTSSYFRMANFQEAHVTNSCFKKANLHEANMKGANFGATNFQDAHLAGADLTNTNLGSCSFLDSTLSGATLKEANLSGVKLQGADLTGAVVNEANLGRVNMSDAEVSGVDAVGANLRATNLQGASFKGSKLKKTIFKKADISQTDFAEANLHQAEMVDADIRSANFERANLTESDLSGACLYNSNLVEADLSAANLSGADLQEVDIEMADLDGADLRNANLIDLLAYGANLNNVHIDSTTEFGDRTIYEKCIDDPRLLNSLGKEKKRTVAEKSKYRLKRRMGLDPSLGMKAIRVYRAYRRLQRENNLPHRTAEFHIREREVRRKEAKENEHIMEYLKLSLSRWATLHGEGPWQVIRFSGGVILVFACFFSLSGFKGLSGEIYSLENILSDPRLYLQAIYLSLVSFVNVSYAIENPIGWGKYVGLIESVLGIILTSLFIFVLGRKTAR